MSIASSHPVSQSSATHNSSSISRSSLPAPRPVVGDRGETANQDARAGGRREGSRSQSEGRLATSRAASSAPSGERQSRSVNTIAVTTTARTKSLSSLDTSLDSGRDRGSATNDDEDVIPETQDVRMGEVHVPQMEVQVPDVIPESQFMSQRESAPVVEAEAVMAEPSRGLAAPTVSDLSSVVPPTDDTCEMEANDNSSQDEIQASPPPPLSAARLPYGASPASKQARRLQRKKTEIESRLALIKGDISSTVAKEKRVETEKAVENIAAEEGGNEEPELEAPKSIASADSTIDSDHDEAKSISDEGVDVTSSSSSAAVVEEAMAPDTRSAEGKEDAAGSGVVDETRAAVDERLNDVRDPISGKEIEPEDASQEDPDSDVDSAELEEELRRLRDDNEQKMEDIRRLTQTVEEEGDDDVFFSPDHEEEAGEDGEGAGRRKQAKLVSAVKDAPAQLTQKGGTKAKQQVSTKKDAPTQQTQKRKPKARQQSSRSSTDASEAGAPAQRPEENTEETGTVQYLSSGSLSEEFDSKKVKLEQKMSASAQGVYRRGKSVAATDGTNERENTLEVVERAEASQASLQGKRGRAVSQPAPNEEEAGKEKDLRFSAKSQRDSSAVKPFLRKRGSKKGVENVEQAEGETATTTTKDTQNMELVEENATEGEDTAKDQSDQATAPRRRSSRAKITPKRGKSKSDKRKKSREEPSDDEQEEEEEEEKEEDEGRSVRDEDGMKDGENRKEQDQIEGGTEDDGKEGSRRKERGGKAKTDKRKKSKEDFEEKEGEKEQIKGRAQRRKKSGGKEKNIAMNVHESSKSKESESKDSHPKYAELPSFSPPPEEEMAQEVERPVTAHVLSQTVTMQAILPSRPAEEIPSSSVENDKDASSLDERTSGEALPSEEEAQRHHSRKQPQSPVERADEVAPDFVEKSQNPRMAELDADLVVSDNGNLSQQGGKSEKEEEEEKTSQPEIQNDPMVESEERMVADDLEPVSENGPMDAVPATTQVEDARKVPEKVVDTFFPSSWEEEEEPPAVTKPKGQLSSIFQLGPVLSKNATLTTKDKVMSAPKSVVATEFVAVPEVNRTSSAATPDTSTAAAASCVGADIDARQPSEVGSRTLESGSTVSLAESSSKGAGSNDVLAKYRRAVANTSEEPAQPTVRRKKTKKVVESPSPVEGSFLSGSQIQQPKKRKLNRRSTSTEASEDDRNGESSISANTSRPSGTNSDMLSTVTPAKIPSSRTTDRAPPVVPTNDVTLSVPAAPAPSVPDTSRPTTPTTATGPSPFLRPQVTPPASKSKKLFTADADYMSQCSQSSQSLANTPKMFPEELIFAKEAAKTDGNKGKGGGAKRGGAGKENGGKRKKATEEDVGKNAQAGTLFHSLEGADGNDAAPAADVAYSSQFKKTNPKKFFRLTNLKHRRMEYSLAEKTALKKKPINKDASVYDLFNDDDEKTNNNGIDKKGTKKRKSSDEEYIPSTQKKARKGTGAVTKAKGKSTKSVPPAPQEEEDSILARLDIEEAMNQRGLNCSLPVNHQRLAAAKNQVVENEVNDHDEDALSPVESETRSEDTTSTTGRRRSGRARGKPVSYAEDDVFLADSEGDGLQVNPVEESSSEGATEGDVGTWVVRAKKVPRDRGVTFQLDEAEEAGEASQDESIDASLAPPPRLPKKKPRSSLQQRLLSRFGDVSADSGADTTLGDNAVTDDSGYGGTSILRKPGRVTVSFQDDEGVRIPGGDSSRQPEPHMTSLERMMQQVQGFASKISCVGSSSKVNMIDFNLVLFFSLIRC